MNTAEDWPLHIASAFLTNCIPKRQLECTQKSLTRQATLGKTSNQNAWKIPQEVNHQRGERKHRILSATKSGSLPALLLKISTVSLEHPETFGWNFTRCIQHKEQGELNSKVRHDWSDLVFMHKTEAQSLRLRMLGGYYSGKSICNLLLKFAMQLIFLNHTHNDIFKWRHFWFHENIWLF